MIDAIEKHYIKSGYSIYKDNSKNFNLNICSVRNSSSHPNKFDDYQCVWYYDNYNNRVEYIYPITTDPGTFWLKNPQNVNGTAIVCPGQYKGFWSIGLHRGYSALVQIGKCKVWRDNNKNNVIDYFKKKHDNADGINCHHSGNYSNDNKNIDKWSAGCQVHKYYFNFLHFKELCKQAALRWGNSFTFTLINSEDLENEI